MVLEEDETKPFLSPTVSLGLLYRNWKTRSTRLVSKPLLAILAALLIVTTGYLLLSESSRSFLSPFASKPPSPPGGSGSGSHQIPNTVHFVYILADPSADLHFQFSAYLALFAANLYLSPTTVYLHTNADAASLTRARAGQSGLWTQRIVTHHAVTVRAAAPPTHAGNGRPLQNMEHRSDFVRVGALEELGGLYIDWDVHVLRDLAPLREAGFAAVGGRELGGMVNSGTFMTAPGSRMISMWREGMHEMYDGGWTTHSNRVVTQVGEELVSVRGEMLIVDREAFAPGSWEKTDGELLFAAHDDGGVVLLPETTDAEGSAERENMTNEEIAASWPKFDERARDLGLGAVGDHEGPAWARRWAATYLLHAFNPNRFGGPIEGFEHITPRYVLERRSNFARAVYPVARRMYELGLFDIDDSPLE